MTDAEPGRTAGVEYGELIDQALKEERERKTSLEARAFAVVTTSGAIVSLVLAVNGLNPKTPTVAGDDLGRWFVGGGLVGFVVAAVLGILANLPTDYGEATVDALDNLTSDDPDYWSSAWAIGSKRRAQLNVDVLRTARDRNGSKAWLVLWAMAAEVAGVGLAAAAVAHTLLG